MKNKFLLTFMISLMCALAFGSINAYAEKYGDYLYYETNEQNTEITITDCDTTATSITIPGEINGLPIVAIAHNAFDSCGNLTDVYIPDSVTYIGPRAFSWCKNLKSVRLPNTITTIDVQTFYACTALTEINLPENVTSIGSSAFQNCSKLTDINIPENLKFIGSDAFLFCDNLQNIYITDLKAYMDIEYANGSSHPNYYNGNNLYLNDSLIVKLVIPEGVREIPPYVFQGYSSIISVSIPDTVTAIGDYAFRGCTSLIKLNIPETVASIGKGAFSSCSSLTEITIPDGISAISQGAFAGCGKLKKVIIPNTVTTIQNDAFYNCQSLSDITIPDKVTTIGGGAFANCLGLTNIHIPESVNDIGSGAFSDCRSLASINIPTNVTLIWGNTFSNCVNLTEIVIPNGVTSIGDYAFESCSRLESITIPDSVKNIGTRAFQDCSTICEINIPSSVTIMGEYAFAWCDNLTKITLPDNLTIIPASAFSGCINLSYINIPQGVEGIENYAFQSCVTAKFVVIPQSVYYIKNDAFSNCEEIKKVFFKGTPEQWNEIIIYSGNEQLTNAEIIYNASKRTYSFETNCDVYLPDVTTYCIAQSPEIAYDGKKLIGWYDNAELSGEAVTFPYSGDADTLYAAWSDKTGTSFGDAILALENEEYNVEVAEDNLIYYEFVPKFTGEYRIYTKGEYDTYGYLYNSNQERLQYKGNGGEDYNFKITFDATAGEKYYIAIKAYETAVFSLVIETDCYEGTKTVCITAATGEKIFTCIPSNLPEDCRIILACYKGNSLIEMQYVPNRNETVCFVVSKSFDTAKVMVRKALGDVMPLTKAETIN